jgi:hypothetical protein
MTNESANSLAQVSPVYVPGSVSIRDDHSAIDIE